MTQMQRFATGLLTIIVGMSALSARAEPADAGSTTDGQRVPFDAIHNSARSVMEQSDFRSVRRRVLERLPPDQSDNGFLEGIIESVGNAISDFLSWLFTPSAPQRPTRTATSPPRSKPSGNSWGDWDLSRGLAIVLILIISVILVWLIARVIRQHQQDPERGTIPSIGDAALEVVTPPGELAASTYESRAEQYARQGDFAAGIRELLLGSMSWIERAGLIRFRRGLTNRDYIRAVWRQEDRCAAYTTTGTEFELVFFGRRTATQEMFERCLTAFQGAFREEAATARDEG